MNDRLDEIITEELTDKQVTFGQISEAIRRVALRAYHLGVNDEWKNPRRYPYSAEPTSKPPFWSDNYRIDWVGAAKFLATPADRRKGPAERRDLSMLQCACHRKNQQLPHFDGRAGPRDRRALVGALGPPVQYCGKCGHRADACRCELKPPLPAIPPYWTCGAHSYPVGLIPYGTRCMSCAEDWRRELFAAFEKEFDGKIFPRKVGQ